MHAAEHSHINFWPSDQNYPVDSTIIYMYQQHTYYVYHIVTFT